MLGGSQDVWDPLDLDGSAFAGRSLWLGSPMAARANDRTGRRRIPHRNGSDALRGSGRGIRRPDRHAGGGAVVGMRGGLGALIDAVSLRFGNGAGAIRGLGPAG